MSCHADEGETADGTSGGEDGEGEWVEDEGEGEWEGEGQEVQGSVAPGGPAVGSKRARAVASGRVLPGKEGGQSRRARAC